MSVPVTGVDGLDHLVPEAILAAATDGRYTAACGRVVLPAALPVPGGRRCPLCWTGRQAVDLPEPERGRRRHSGARRLRSIQRRARARRGRLGRALRLPVENELVVIDRLCGSPQVRSRRVAEPDSGRVRRR
jgi:hypothetical protein